MKEDIKRLTVSGSRLRVIVETEDEKPKEEPTEEAGE